MSSKMIAPKHWDSGVLLTLVFCSSKPHRHFLKTQCFKKYVFALSVSLWAMPVYEYVELNSTTLLPSNHNNKVPPAFALLHSGVKTSKQTNKQKAISIKHQWASHLLILGVAIRKHLPINKMLIPGSVTKAPRSTCKDIPEKDPCIRLHHVRAVGWRPHHHLVLGGMNNTVARVWSEFHSVVHLLHLFMLSLL